jgi:hypothetical protein
MHPLYVYIYINVCIELSVMLCLEHERIPFATTSSQTIYEMYIQFVEHLLCLWGRNRREWIQFVHNFKVQKVVE